MCETLFLDALSFIMNTETLSTDITPPLAQVSTVAPRRLYSIPEIKVMTVCEPDAPSGVKLNAATVVANFFRETISKCSWFDASKECFVVCFLNRKNRLKSFIPMANDAAGNPLVDPCTVFRAAIVASATGIICIHNHPSGCAAPSTADIQLTRLLREAAKLITNNMHFQDHVIIGRPGDVACPSGHYSMREAGIL
jgi:DNA repair protein RadC